MREELLTRMIRIYGFEHSAVIQFAKKMEENATDEELIAIVEEHEASVWEDEDEEEEEIEDAEYFRPTPEDLKEAWWEG